MKAAEAQLRRHQSAAAQQQGEGGDKPASVEATFEQETKVRDELAKQLSQISQKYSGYCQREMAVQARMVERETKMQENNVNQEKVTEEMNRLKAVLMLRKNPEEKTLLDEFAAFDHKPSEKHQEFTSLQHEDVAKQKRFAEKKATLQEHEEHLVSLQVNNQKNLLALEAHSAASKRLLSQLMAAEKADVENASLRKDAKTRKLQTRSNLETELAESRQHQLAQEAEAMQEQQHRQQRLQDERIQAEQQAQAEAYAIQELQEQAEQQAAMAQAETRAIAEQEEQRRQLLQEEQQRQQEWQNYLREKMVEEKKREETLFAEHQQEQEHLKAELAAEEQKHITMLKEQHQQRLQLLEERSKQQQHELFQAKQQVQLELQQRLEATNTLQLLPPLELSEEESTTPVAKRPKPYAQLRGALPTYMPPSSKAAPPLPATLPQAKAPGAYQSFSQIPAAFASQMPQTPTQVAFTPGRLEGGSGLFLTAPAKPGLRTPVVVPPRPSAVAATPPNPSSLDPPTPEQPLEEATKAAPAEQPLAPEAGTYLGQN